MIAVESEALVHYMCGIINLPSHCYSLQESKLFSKPTRSLAVFKAAWKEEYTTLWKQKPLHGQFPSQIEAITTPACAHQWLHFSHLKIETEAMITACCTGSS